MEGDVFMFKSTRDFIVSNYSVRRIRNGNRSFSWMATPLTSLNVVQVESELGGVETINQNSFSTSRNHGENIYILQRKELGYGQNPFAKMNGSNVKVLIPL